MGHDIEGLDFIEVEVPSHRRALGNAWREGCNRIIREPNKSNQLISFKGVSVNRTIISLAAIATVIVLGAVVLVTSLLLFPSGTGEATDNLVKSELMEKALRYAKENMPGSEAVEENEDYSNDLNVAFKVKDGLGEDIGMVVIDRATGEIGFFFDARSSSAARASSEVKIGLEEATSIARGFLEALGVDLEHFMLENDPLVCVGMEGPPDNPVPVYSYEFNYRMQVNGIFVDGEASCFVIISPVDGSIKSFSIPRSLVSINDLDNEEIKISEEEAINVVSEEVKGRKNLEGTTPVVKNDNIELRYMVKGNSRLIPYWRITVQYCMDDLADKDIPEEAKYMGGCIYSVSAVDGQVLFEESF